MTLSVYSHYMVNDRFERLAPALVRRFIQVINYKVQLNEFIHDRFWNPEVIK